MIKNIEILKKALCFHTKDFDTQVIVVNQENDNIDDPDVGYIEIFNNKNEKVSSP